MSFVMRDKDRYGKYAVCIPEIGDCIFVIDISGFGESFELYHEDKCIFMYDTEEDDFENTIETDSGFMLRIEYPYYKDVFVKYTDMRKLDEI